MYEKRVSGRKPGNRREQPSSHRHPETGDLALRIVSAESNVMGCVEFRGKKPKRGRVKFGFRAAPLVYLSN